MDLYSAAYFDLLRSLRMPFTEHLHVDLLSRLYEARCHRHYNRLLVPISCFGYVRVTHSVPDPDRESLYLEWAGYCFELTFVNERSFLLTFFESKRGQQRSILQMLCICMTRSTAQSRYRKQYSTALTSKNICFPRL